MPGLAPRSAATSKKDCKKAASRSQTKEGGGESARDATQSAGCDAGVSSEAGNSVNMFVKDIFERIAGEASRLARYSKRSTITSREIHTAMRLLLPCELAKHAGPEDTKAASKYASAKRA
ncbi:Histone H2B type 1-A [Sciurus carolinensis]|uniref:Histone H2B type 1-A n=1 Tax=Sciurus carolinensis TaxID=30640 RepID=A0AA41SUV6_SCICA|nr:histone H2B type 1-A-like [Sciurus carolinensis]MBZ3873670.1 Histone H2B type 1-A [Sciurus carolinensis]MBZ3873706.1 Histone H2B type 1-A [Sciurus carolinensis]